MNGTMGRAYVESVVLPWVPSERFDVAPYCGADAACGCAGIKRSYGPVVATCEQHRWFGRVPLHGLHLVFVDVEASYGARFVISTLAVRNGAAAQIPQFDCSICARACEEVALSFVPAEAENGVDVVPFLRSTMFRLFSLLFSRPDGSWDVRFCGFRSAQDRCGVHGLQNVQRPDFNFRIERSDGNVVPEPGRSSF